MLHGSVEHRLLFDVLAENASRRNFEIGSVKGG